jgi:putative ABC transport system permease protein
LDSRSSALLPEPHPNARLAAALFFGVEPADPLTYALVALVIAIVGLAACYSPARRATRVDPIVVLRQE